VLMETRIQKLRHVAFTSVNSDYLGRALTLTRSVKKHDPSIYFVLLLVEPEINLTSEIKKKLLDCDGGSAFDEILTLDDLDLSQNKEFKDYTVVEMCTAVKGQAVLHLLARETSKFVTYLDPDLLFYDSLEQIRSEHSRGDVLLTPHLNHVPYLDQVILNDEIAGVMRHGLFNLGFVSFTNTKSGRDVASWWADRLNISSRADYQNGLFTDQKWWDLSQIYFQCTAIVRNDGWNMAAWNINERRLVSLSPPMLDSGDKLFFFHFSKYPSKDFQLKIQSYPHSKLLDDLIIEYGHQFSAAETYVKQLLLDIRQQKKTSQVSVSRRAGLTLRMNSLLTSFLNSAIRNHYLSKFVSSNPFFYKLARYIFRQFHRLIVHIDKIADETIQTVDNKELKLDVLIISHIGGGGVAEIVSEKVRQYLALGKSVGVLKPNQVGELTISINSSRGVINVNNQLSQILKNASKIELHHILGIEGFLDEFLTRKIDTVYLHDKYFMTQMPFSDTLQNISILHDVPGINSPLNTRLEFSDEEWRAKTERLLLNSQLLLAPSDYLINEYQSAFPNLNIKKFNLEPNFEFKKGTRSTANVENIVLISPTGLHKGSSILLQLAKQLEIDRPSLRFKIYGDLQFATREELSKMENITLYGQVSRPRLNNALATSIPKLGWIPSLTGESYSLALSDFLSNGITVIAAKSGALQERLIESSGHYLYDPAIPTQILAKLILAIVSNKSLEEFDTFLELT